MWEFSAKASEIKLQVPHMRICKKLGSTVKWMVDLESQRLLFLCFFDAIRVKELFGKCA